MPPAFLLPEAFVQYKRRAWENQLLKRRILPRCFGMVTVQVPLSRENFEDFHSLSIIVYYAENAVSNENTVVYDCFK